MQKVYSIENLDCANCAAKMEDAIKKIPQEVKIYVYGLNEDNTIVSFVKQYTR